MSDFKYWDEMTKQEKEDFIDDLVIHYDEITTSDLQAIVQARCMNITDIMTQFMQTDEILDIVYERIEKGE